MSDLSAVGVYRWPYTEEDVETLARDQWSDRWVTHIERSREHLAGLVLIELAVSNASRELIGGLSQAHPSSRDDSTQVPYDESWWNEDGTQCLGWKPPPAGTPCRVVFFLHFFESGAPLFASDGVSIQLPSPTPVPARLEGKVKYQSP